MRERPGIVEGIIRAQASLEGSGLLVEPGHNLQDDGSQESAGDGGLHAPAGVACYACNGSVRTGDDIRVTPKDSRHANCP
jgi:hypothetical protein